MKPCRPLQGCIRFLEIPLASKLYASQCCDLFLFSIAHVFILCVSICGHYMSIVVRSVRWPPTYRRQQASQYLRSAQINVYA